MIKVIIYTVIFLIFIFLSTYTLYRLTFFPESVFTNRNTPKIEFKRKLPVVKKNQLFRISQLKELPIESVILIEGKIVSIKREKNGYSGEIEDITGKVNFFLPEDILEKNSYIQEIIDDAVYMDVSFSFIVKLKKGYVEVIDIM